MESAQDHHSNQSASSDADAISVLAEAEAVNSEGNSEVNSEIDSCLPNSFHPRFATVELLSPFIPQAALKDSSTEETKFWDTKFHVLLLQTCIISGVVLLLNVVGTIVLKLKSKNYNIFHGSCQKASEISSALHVLINVLSTLLLSASNLSIQILAAPLREEVDSAHRKNRWMDIGIPSLRDLKYVAAPRRIFWWALALSSIPLHFL